MIVQNQYLLHMFNLNIVNAWHATQIHQFCPRNTNDISISNPTTNTWQTGVRSGINQITGLETAWNFYTVTCLLANLKEMKACQERMKALMDANLEKMRAIEQVSPPCLFCTTWEPHSQGTRQGIQQWHKILRHETSATSGRLENTRGPWADPRAGSHKAKSCQWVTGQCGGARSSKTK